jgi:hypothetical protein
MGPNGIPRSKVMAVGPTGANRGNQHGTEGSGLGGPLLRGNNRAILVGTGFRRSGEGCRFLELRQDAVAAPRCGALLREAPGPFCLAIGFVRPVWAADPELGPPPGASPRDAGGRHPRLTRGAPGDLECMLAHGPGRLPTWSLGRVAGRFPRDAGAPSPARARGTRRSRVRAGSSAGPVADLELDGWWGASTAAAPGQLTAAYP